VARMCATALCAVFRALTLAQRTAFTTLQSALEAHILPRSQSPSDDAPAAADDQSDAATAVQIPGVYIDPDESAGLPEALHSLPEADSEAESERGELPFPSQAASSQKRKTGILSSLGLRRRGVSKSTPIVKPRASGRHDNADTHNRSGITTRTGVLAALLAFQNLDDVSLPPTPRPSSPPPTRSRRQSTSSTASGSSSRPISLVTDRVYQQRPAAQRNGAGVFGALVATTGNIAGAAAPTSSTLQPDIKAKGYKVSRYTPSGTSAPSKRASFPSRLSLPPSAAGSGASSTAAASPELEHPPVTLSASAPSTPFGMRHRVGLTLSNLPRPFPQASSAPGTPHSEAESDGGYFLPRHAWSGSRPPSIFGEKTSNRDREAERRRKTRRTKAQVFITRHVAEVRARHDFLLRLARSMMMFGAPTHRLPAQLQATARVLDVPLACVYLPDVMILSFDDAETQTSSVKLIRQGSGLDLEKLADAYSVYWRVIHDEASVTAASAELDALMVRSPCYKPWQLVLIGGACSFAICINAFSGSFLDAVISFPLGGLLVAVQMLSARNELFSAVFEIAIATLQSFLAGALASTHAVCYSAVASASIVLILPGFIILSGALEITNRNIVSGAVRLCYAIVYSLFLGFGLAAGAQIFTRVSNTRIVGPEDYSCAETHDPHGGWWQRTPSLYFNFITVPLYSLVLSLRQQAPLRRPKDLALLVGIACAGWTSNHFVGLAFPGQSDISAAVGAFVVGVLANTYGRLCRANAFAVMITGILFQLPSGLGNGGLLNFASDASAGSANTTTYLSGFQTALQLVSVGIGLTVGLGFSLLVVHPIQSRKRAAGIFSL
jgi:uncharacterized membrane protein YjjP (DUF1212 family)